MSLQSTYANKKSDYQNTFNSLQKVNAGKPRQLKYKHITFCNLSAKKTGLHDNNLPSVYYPLSSNG